MNPGKPPKLYRVSYWGFYFLPGMGRQRLLVAVILEPACASGVFVTKVAVPGGRTAFCVVYRGVEKHLLQMLSFKPRMPTACALKREKRAQNALPGNSDGDVFDASAPGHTGSHLSKCCAVCSSVLLNGWSCDTWIPAKTPK